MRTRPVLALAGAAALGGATFLVPALAAGGVENLTADVVIDCVAFGPDATNHSYTITLTNHTDGDIDVNGDATLSVNGGAATPVLPPNESDPVVDNGDTFTYPTFAPVVPDGDQAITAVFHVTYEGQPGTINVTATAEACETGPTPTTAAPTTSTSTPAVQAAVDFTG